MRRRAYLWLFATLLLFLLLTSLNVLVFRYAEGLRLSPMQSALFVIETITTTGFGSLTPVKAPLTQLWVILLMGAGLLLIAGLLTSFLHTWVGALVNLQPPPRAPKNLKGHIIIVGAGPIGRYVAQACRRAHLPYLLLDRDQQLLRQALQEGLQTVGGDPGSLTTLQGARLAQARALILTERDGANLTLLLQSQALEVDLPRYATQEELPPALLKRAGATGVVSAKRRLGQRMGALAIAPYANALAEIGRHLDGLIWATVPVLPGTLLAGTTIAQAALRERSGALVLGVVTRGLFLPAAQVTHHLYPGDLLIVAGRTEAIGKLRQLCGVRLFQPDQSDGPVLILGAGNAGRAAAAFLKVRGTAVWVIDERPLPPGWQVDRFTLGNATRAGDLRKAGAAAVHRCIIALPDDEAAMIAAMALRGLNGGARLVCRANAVESVAPLYLTGAEAVVALPEVGGAALARMAIPSGVRLPALGDLAVREVPVPPSWVGRSLGKLDLHGLLCLAVRRPDGEIELGPEPGAPLVAGERLFLFGTGEALGGL